MIKRLLDIRHELMKFGSVGAVAYVISVGGFNLLVHIPNAIFAEKPLT
ncbi:MAG: GtrA family protein, partial [Actinobacteria bacterium]|nr:GtrA family protein [Actinomycetota bacterium]